MPARVVPPNLRRDHSTRPGRPRANPSTATNQDSRWLFPGRRAGQPLHPSTLAALVHFLGVPTTAGRAAAIRQHVLA
ncbi:hypothetical protein [Micromonospora inyonensis]|uniref:hypothetical protein n=1 Tax=Micromonospora inyonensis TaxID=47866 RepID=UPI000B1C8BBF|nr:hypothetical protein [Micromonospora inyonensis]